MNPDDEVMEELEYAKRRHRSDGLILVTSLIDKVPNLGGKLTEKHTEQVIYIWFMSKIMCITNVLCINMTYFCEHMHVHSAYTGNVEELEQ